jgi:hypothetical protein
MNKFVHCEMFCCVYFVYDGWHAPKFLKRPKSGSHNGTTEKKEVGARSLAHNTYGVGGHVGALGWD